MREDFWSFDPSHVFMVLTNHRPVVGGTDEGIWRRIRLIPWEVRSRSRSGTGSWATGWRWRPTRYWPGLAGYRDWREHGLADPAKVLAATGAYRAESDAVARFIDQRCIEKPDFAVQSAELFAAWSKWCAAEGEEQGRRPRSRSRWSTADSTNGITSSARSGMESASPVMRMPDLWLTGLTGCQVYRPRVGRKPRNPSYPSGCVTREYGGSGGLRGLTARAWDANLRTLRTLRTRVQRASRGQLMNVPASKAGQAPKENQSCP